MIEGLNIDYSDAPAGIHAAFTYGGYDTVDDGSGGTDTIGLDDYFWGSEHADTIDLAENPPYVRALGGNDAINGGIRDDVVDGGEGDDQISGGRGYDTLVGARATTRSPATARPTRSSSATASTTPPRVAVTGTS